MKALAILNNDNIFDDTYVSENNYKKLINEAISELEALENRSCNNCRNSSFEVKFGELEFNACFLVSNGNVCKWESK